MAVDGCSRGRGTTVPCVGLASRGTGSYGYGLARQLQAAGVEVREVNRPNRSPRRLRGKSDPLDAEVAARAVLSGEATAVPKDRDGPVGQLRALMVARRGAVKARTQTSNQIKALLVTCEEAVRSRLQGRRDSELARCCGRLRSTDGTKTALRSLGRRWLYLDEEATVLQAEITRIVGSVAPKLLLRPGVGVFSAAQLLIRAGDNPGRLRTEAAFAALWSHSRRCIIWEDHPQAPEPRRGSLRERRSVDDRPRPHGARSTDPRLRGPKDPTRQHAKGDPADPQALHRTRALPDRP